MTTHKIGDIVIRKVKTVKSEFVAMEEANGWLSLLKPKVEYNKPMESETEYNKPVKLESNKPMVKTGYKVLHRPKRILDLNMCRICNAKRAFISIYNDFQPQLPQEIFNFSGITVGKNDKLPQKMCQRCLDLLNGCISFREMCQKTNSVLRDLLNRQETNHVDYGDIIHIDSLKNEDDNEEVDIVDNTDDNIFNPFCDIKLPDGDTSYAESAADVLIKNAAKNDNDKNYVGKHILCEICGKTERNLINYEMHMNMHEKKFPFQCDKCPYRGRTKCLLKTHLRSHIPKEEKPFKCKLCPYTVSTASNLKRHMKSVHSSEKPFKCTFCDKLFSLRATLSKHIKVVHSKGSSPLYKCDVCHKAYADRNHFTRHRRLIHKIKAERHGRAPAYLLAQRDPEEE